MNFIYIIVFDFVYVNSSNLFVNLNEFKGGTEVTISGTGLSKDVQVLFGDKEAELLSVHYDVLTCISPAVSNNPFLNWLLDNNYSYSYC